MSRTKSKNFQLLKLFPCYSLLWVPDISPKTFNLHNTHQKSDCQTLFFILSTMTDTTTGQKFRLTLALRLRDHLCSELHTVYSLQISCDESMTMHMQQRAKNIANILLLP